MTPRIALFYDWLNQWGGGERLLLDLIKIYPDAPVFTSVYDPSKTPWLPKNTKVIPSIFNKFSPFKTNSLLSLFLQPLAFEQLDFSKFNIVISLTSMHGKCLLTPPSTCHICYCLTPNRYLYSKNNFIFNFYKKSDYIYAQRPDFYLTTSKTVQKRIKKYFHRDSVIVYPGIDLTKFKPLVNSASSYFLIVSRLVKHKRLDLAIQACQKLNLPLKIVGTGRDGNYFKSLVKKQNIEFLDQIPETKLINLYQNCRALICPQTEDFGYTVLEAQACGKPVIAYKRGGHTETVINHKTGLFFDDQTLDSLIKTLEFFNPKRFNKLDCINNASQFSKTRFMINFKKSIDRIWYQHLKK